MRGRLTSPSCLPKKTPGKRQLCEARRARTRTAPSTHLLWNLSMVIIQAKYSWASAPSTANGEFLPLSIRKLHALFKRGGGGSSCCSIFQIQCYITWSPCFPLKMNQAFLIPSLHTNSWILDTYCCHMEHLQKDLERRVGKTLGTTLNTNWRYSQFWGFFKWMLIVTAPGSPPELWFFCEHHVMLSLGSHLKGKSPKPVDTSPWTWVRFLQTTLIADDTLG